MQLLLSLTCVAAASALSATTQTPSTRVKLPNLKAEAFRHPLDKDATAAVQRSPLRFFETAVRTGLAPPLEQMTRLDNLATGVKVTAKQYPELYESFQEAITCLGDADAEALAVAFGRRHEHPSEAEPAEQLPDQHRISALFSLVILSIRMATAGR